jgi:hypothetical protein
MVGHCSGPSGHPGGVGVLHAPPGRDPVLPQTVVAAQIDEPRERQRLMR